MTHAELLRSHANLAIKEGGMYYSGEYLSRVAAAAESLEAENARLRELVRDLHKALFTLDIDHCQACPRDNINGLCTKFMVCGSDECSIEEDMRELGVEVIAQ